MMCFCKDCKWWLPIKSTKNTKGICARIPLRVRLSRIMDWCFSFEWCFEKHEKGTEKTEALSNLPKILEEQSAEAGEEF